MVHWKKRGGAFSLALSLVVVLGAALRWGGLDYGLPFPLVSDEEVMLGGVLKMFQLRTLVPAWHVEEMAILYYPVGLPYLYMAVLLPWIAVSFALAGFPSPGDFGLSILLNHQGTIFFIARLVSFAMALASIALVMRLAERLTGSWLVALVGGLLFSVDYLHVVQSQVARHWSATVFIIWLCAFLAEWYWRKPRLILAVIIGCLAGWGFGVSYIAALGGGFGGVAHIVAWRAGRTRLFAPSFWALGGCFIAVALVLTALYPQPMARLLFRILPIDDPKTIAGLFGAGWFYAKALFFSNPGLVVGAGLGLVMCALRRQWWFLGGGVFLILFYTAFLYKFMPLEDRYILPLVPVLAILAGLAVEGLYQMIAPRTMRLAKAVTVGGILALTVYPAAVSAQMTALMARADSRLVALEWVEQNLVQSDVRILGQLNAVRLVPTLESLSVQQTLEPDSLKSIDRQRMTMEAHLPQAWTAIDLWMVAEAAINRGTIAELPERLRSLGYTHYMVDSYSSSIAPDLYEALRAEGELVWSLEPAPDGPPPPNLRTTTQVPYPLHSLYKMERLGPMVEIYALAEPGQSLSQED